MRFPKTYNLETIAQIIGCEFIGDPNFEVFGSNEIHVVQPGEIVFVDHPKYYDKALNSNASVILINKEVPCPEGKALLISDDPFRDFNKISTYFRPFQKSDNLISHSAIVGEGTILQPNVILGNNVTIGKNCLIHANVVIYDNTIIGDNVIIHSGTVLGADAFYFKKRETYFDPLISCGRVIIEDNVTIGASCTIDRGVTGDTTIGEGSKLDNQIQIGHDTVVGKMCLIASQVGIAGCVVIKNHVTIWGQVGITSGVTIGEKVSILAQSGVSKNLEQNKVYFGTPAEESREKLKQIAYLKRLTK
ncbi:UDP-3-O-(3-hydroxymyristoyl)glucosamine N-acyltransferase [Paenimyroides tangerinum]|uniref:UDP-3-O-(3-hydroxymyristoyl)glucosamine N-acyltransferase n=1 Tax=Paenimyroides tangerinum TaxID=2488728 RepID=A0A3P3W0H6_9FLAO|nr:UDP-3-O-(3-hydroxymyristoyl)glucosamine N-acyltransferase [Paenimyroides tangerinum]RRJ88562.1 UDP-3-O-(3-hydroxymyristoyl)glucosamine N-acyltransferase [Paenimyroides tangerinum]